MVAVRAVPEEPSDDDAGYAGSDQDNPDRGFGIAEHVANPNIVAVVETDENQCRNDGGDDHESHDTGKVDRRAARPRSVAHGTPIPGISETEPTMR